MIDKARAALAGTAGGYLCGDCPIDRSLLRALGLSAADFGRIVRDAGGEDERIAAAIETRCAANLDLARRWSEALPRRHPSLLFLIDLDEGYATGWVQTIRPVIRFLYGIALGYIHRRWPSRGALITLEMESEAERRRAESLEGAVEQPYRWLTAHNVDLAWKMLFVVVLVGVIFFYIIRFIERIGVVAVIIIAAIFFAYLIYPIVRWLNKRLPLIVAILVLYLALIALVAFGFSYLFPAIASEVTTLTHEWPSIVAKLQAYIATSPLLGHLPAQFRTELEHFPQRIAQWISHQGIGAAGSALQVVIGTAAVIGALIVIPVLAAYLLYDSETIKRFVMGFVPQQHRDGTLTLLSELEQVIGGFIRGQIMVGVSVGILIAVGLYLIHEPYAILLAAIAGAFDLIPYIGPFIAVIPALIIGFVSGGINEAIWVGVVFIIANQAEGHILSPNIVSRTIQLSPSAVVLAILIGGELYGIIGMFIAVPVAGIIRVLLLHVIPGSVSRIAAQPVLTHESRRMAEPTMTEGVGENSE